MPRAYSPPLVVAPIVHPFVLDKGDKQRLARALGLVELSPEIALAISHVISCYMATQAGSKDTTVANTFVALGELGKKGRIYQKAVAKIADDRCGVDYTTHLALQPLAKGVLAGSIAAKEQLAEAVERRKIELQYYERVSPQTEALRFFCGSLRLIFNLAAASTLNSSIEDAWRYCRKFAMEVLTIAGIECPDFEGHPGRLTEYLGTDVTVN
jgi:hypothetical protein